MHLLEIVAAWAWETSIAASILAGLAVVVSIVLRKASLTPMRYVLGLLVIARLLMPISIPSPFSVFNLFKGPVESGPIVSKAAPSVALPMAIQIQNASSVHRNFIAPRRDIAVLPIIWACGVAAILSRLFWQHRRVQRWVAGEKIVSGPAFEVFESVLALTKCRRTVCIYTVSELRTPALFGVFRPAILLPKDLIACGDLPRLRLVFLHEIAHLRRMDGLVNWLGIFARALHWFNPLVWLVLRRLRIDQELLCDRDVMRALRPEEHHSYGETLLALASSRGFELSTLIPVSSNFKQLKERIAMIKQFKPVTNRLLLFALPPLVAILAIVTFTAATEKKPTPAAIEKRSDLNADVNRRKKRIAVLQGEADLQRERVRKAEAKVDELRKALGLAPVRTESDLFASESETLKNVETERIHAQQEYVQLQEQWKSLKSKSRDAQIRMMPTSYHDGSLETLLDNLIKSEHQLATLRKDYGDDHQEVQRLTALIKTVNRQIDSRVADIMEGMEAQVSTRRSIAESAQKQVIDLKLAEAEQAEKARPYFEAMRDLEIQRKLLEAIQLRLGQERIDLMLDEP